MSKQMKYGTTIKLAGGNELAIRLTLPTDEVIPRDTIEEIHRLAVNTMEMHNRTVEEGGLDKLNDL